MIYAGKGMVPVGGNSAAQLPATFWWWWDGAMWKLKVFARE